MIQFINKLFGGSKSEKDVKKILPVVTKINEYFQQYQSISNNDLRNKTQEFKGRIQHHLTEIDAQIAERKNAAATLPETDINGKDAIYQEIDELRKERNKKIEIALEEILPEAFAVVKEAARQCYSAR
jgi:preprotein translocase subunit SecA